MRILAISDIHNDFAGFAPATLPVADLCLVAGDLTHYGCVFLDAVQEARIWLAALGERMPVLWIPGNHDIRVTGEVIGAIPNVTCCLNRTVEAGGLLIRGVSLSPCYNLPEMMRIWDYMTADPERERAAYDFEPVDIVLSHCPPAGCCDGSGGRRATLGSEALRAYVLRHAPRLVVCGHIHEAAGQAMLGASLVCNAAGAAAVVDMSAASALAPLRWG